MQVVDFLEAGKWQHKGSILKQSLTFAMTH